MLTCAALVSPVTKPIVEEEYVGKVSVNIGFDMRGRRSCGCKGIGIAYGIGMVAGKLPASRSKRYAKERAF